MRRFDPKQVAALATDPDARVMVLIDGQNLYKGCRELFQHPHCHPHLLAQHLAGPRANTRVATRFYTGRPSPNIDGERVKARNLDRRLAGMRSNRVTVQTRQLRYHWDWGHRQHLPRAKMGASEQLVMLGPWQRPQEKGIDVLIALDAVEFILDDKCDVAIVVSLDRDLTEIPQAIRNIAKFRKSGKPYRLEAAVMVPSGRDKPKQLKTFDYTHQITPSVFETIRDDTDYTVDNSLWAQPMHPPDLEAAKKARGLL